jgi:hypothetical protein
MNNTNRLHKRKLCCRLRINERAAFYFSVRKCNLDIFYDGIITIIFLFLIYHRPLDTVDNSVISSAYRVYSFEY